MLLTVFFLKKLFAFDGPATLHVLPVPSCTPFGKNPTWLISWDAAQFLYFKKKNTWKSATSQYLLPKRSMTAETLHLLDLLEIVYRFRPRSDI